MQSLSMVAGRSDDHECTGVHGVLFADSVQSVINCIDLLFCGQNAGYGMAVWYSHVQILAKVRITTVQHLQCMIQRVSIDSYFDSCYDILVPKG